MLEVQKSPDGHWLEGQPTSRGKAALLWSAIGSVADRTVTMRAYLAHDIDRPDEAERLRRGSHWHA